MMNICGVVAAPPALEVDDFPVTRSRLVDGVDPSADPGAADSQVDRCFHEARAACGETRGLERRHGIAGRNVDVLSVANGVVEVVMEVIEGEAAEVVKLDLAMDFHAALEPCGRSTRQSIDLVPEESLWARCERDETGHGSARCVLSEGGLGRVGQAVNHHA